MNIRVETLEASIDEWFAYMPPAAAANATVLPSIPM
jgi:hypothetical protein